jgi:hypothetical protein
MHMADALISPAVVGLQLGSLPWSRGASTAGLSGLWHAAIRPRPLKHSPAPRKQIEIPLHARALWVYANERQT